MGMCLELRDGKLARPQYNTKGIQHMQAKYKQHTSKSRSNRVLFPLY